MSKLNVDQKNIGALFSDKRSDFIIPDYQRPYAWTEEECQTLWEDIFAFAFPENDKDKFNNDDEYYLGPIVTFKNDNSKMEVIDGQQRLTTLMLLLRAFYVKFLSAADNDTIRTRENIAKCIWKTDEFGNPNMEELKIDSEVATDNDKDEFLEILKTGDARKELRSKYANNFRFFQTKIQEFADKFPMYLSYFPTRILNNCILLPIEADNQNTALRIFSTLNDRGLPLSDADIFKAQFYKYYSAKGEKDAFIKKWKELEETCEKIFKPQQGTPMDELFTRYMYYERAKQGNKSSTTEALRKFYEKEDYAILKNDQTLNNLSALADFWNDIANQDEERFSKKILRKLFILNYAPNGMWNYFVSVYFMQNKNSENQLEEDKFYNFLDTIIPFIWAYAVYNPGVNALRTPVYAEMINIVNNRNVTFEEFKFELSAIKNSIENYRYMNQRPITKSMLTWWAFENENQDLLDLSTSFEIEHIFAKNRQENEKSLTNPDNIETLGNKSLLEKRINIRASDYRFEDKIKYYKGFTNARGVHKEGTKIEELLSMADNKNDYTEQDIKDRNNDIIESFLNYMKKKNLIK